MEPGPGTAELSSQADTICFSRCCCCSINSGLCLDAWPPTPTADRQAVALYNLTSFRRVPRVDEEEEPSACLQSPRPILGQPAAAATLLRDAAKVLGDEGSLQDRGGKRWRGELVAVAQ